MSPAGSEATARAGAPAPARRPSRPRPTAVPEVAPTPQRFRRISGAVASLRDGNQLGRIATLAAIALFASVFGVVVFQTLIVQGQARLDNLSARTKVEDQRAKDLHQQVADLESPTRIVAAAKALGMIDAGGVAYLPPGVDDDAKATYVAPPPTTPPTTAATTTKKKSTTSTTPKSTKSTTPTTTAPSTTPTTTKKSTTTTTVKGTKP